jgi:prepilin-type N-terminal cleavage/methylation domain-containing protein
MFERTHSFLKKSRAGFTIIELLLVIVIIGTILAVIIPRAWRANIEAKYGLVQQAATELGSWGMTWAERNLESQDESFTCNVQSYVNTLLGFTGGERQSGTLNNWAGLPTLFGGLLPCRGGNNVTYTVADIMSPIKQPRNPFTGISYFNPGSNGFGTNWAPGQLYLARGTVSGAPGGQTFDYYFVYHGTDSTGSLDWHAGMGSGGPFFGSSQLGNLRNGIFMARLIQ